MVSGKLAQVVESLAEVFKKLVEVIAKEILAKVSRSELISDLRTGKSTNINSS
jgi:hypothetical protein